MSVLRTFNETPSYVPLPLPDVTFIDGCIYWYRQRRWSAIVTSLSMPCRCRVWFKFCSFTQLHMFHVFQSTNINKYCSTTPSQTASVRTYVGTGGSSVRVCYCILNSVSSLMPTYLMGRPSINTTIMGIFFCWFPSTQNRNFYALLLLVQGCKNVINPNDSLFSW